MAATMRPAATSAGEIGRISFQRSDARIRFGLVENDVYDRRGVYGNHRGNPSSP
jgi:hypothetical protein